MFTRALIVIGLVVLLIPPASAQEDTVRLEPRIDLTFIQEDDALPRLSVRVRVKRDKGWEPIKWVIVNLFLNEETKLGMMGNITTDVKGSGTFILPEKFIPAWDSLDQFTFIGRIKGDTQVTDASETLTINRSRLAVSTQVIDSVRKVTVSLTKREKGRWIPVPETDLSVFIHRQFGRLTIGEDTYTTDENGQVEVDFSVNIPGDKDGNILIGAWIEDNDELGNRVSLTQAPWGSPLAPVQDHSRQRTLWSSRDLAPFWLLAISNGMLLLVWGVVVYLLFILFRMKREQGNV